jgi:hypothetical protein
VAVPRHERQWGAASEFINGKISAEDFQQRVQELITARGDKNSTFGASSVDQQHPKTAINSNIPVDPTEVFYMSGRRLSHFFAKAMPTATRTALLEHRTGYSSLTRQQQN